MPILKSSGLSRTAIFGQGLLLAAGLSLGGCATEDSRNIIQGLFGYIPPPEQTTVKQELKAEYRRCKAAGGDNCAQQAYDVVRRVKGLDPKPIPEGYVIIVQEELEKDEPESQDEND